MARCLTLALTIERVVPGISGEQLGKLAATILFTNTDVQEVQWRHQDMWHSLTYRRARALYWCKVQGGHVTVKNKPWPTCHVSGLPCPSDRSRQSEEDVVDQVSVTLRRNGGNGTGVLTP